jgi:hypothetical protein
VCFEVHRSHTHTAISMASGVLRRGAPLSGTVSRVLLIAMALVASPRRLGASSAADAEVRTSSAAPDWHVVSVASLLPAAVCTPSIGTEFLQAPYCVRSFIRLVLTTPYTQVDAEAHEYASAMRRQWFAFALIRC